MERLTGRALQDLLDLGFPLTTSTTTVAESTTHPDPENVSTSPIQVTESENAPHPEEPLPIDPSAFEWVDGAWDILVPHQPQAHVEDGHATKSSLCKGCLVGDGPLKPHYRKDPHTRMKYCLHADIADPLLPVLMVFHYFLVGALRLRDQPLFFHVQLLKTRLAQEVTASLSEMTNFLEANEVPEAQSYQS
eukprot:1592162-Amphidinium_carterae.1